MVYAGLDVHKRCTQICLEDESGALVERRILTERHRLLEEFGGKPPMRILLESATESEWVARCLESAGHEVNRRRSEFRTDVRPAKPTGKDRSAGRPALMEACKVGAYKPAHRCSDTHKRVRARISARDLLVQTRTKCISLVRALLRHEGIKPERKSSATFAQRVRQIGVPEALANEIAPVLDLIDALNEKIRRADERVSELAKDETHQRLMTVPGVGPVTAVAFIATLDNPKRCHGPKQVRAYLGLVPREHSSGEKALRGRITKQGSGRMRRLLVQAAWAVLRSRPTPEAEILKRWTTNVASRRGRYVAIVALARRLAGILFAVWRDGTSYRVPGPLGGREVTT